MKKITLKKTICCILAISIFAISNNFININTFAETSEPSTNTQEENKNHPDILIGDASNDHHVSIDDATLIQKEIAMFERSEVFDVVDDISILDIDQDGCLKINDATLIQRYCAEFDDVIEKCPQIGTPIYKWQDDVYETTYETIPAKTEEVKVIDREAFTEEVDVIEHIDEEECKCVYRSGWDAVCNDCGMVLSEDDGSPMSNSKVQEHIILHAGGVLPVTAHDPVRYVTDCFGNEVILRPGDSAVILSGEKDEKGNYMTEEVFYDESLPIYGYGAYGSYSIYKNTDKVPTGEMTILPTSDYIPVYRSGEAYFCNRCGKIMYFEDGKEYDVRDMVRHVMKECPFCKTESSETIGVEKRQTDEIPTGQFTDIPKHIHKETIEHPEKYHMEERIIEPETIIERKVLISEAGYKKIF